MVVRWISLLSVINDKKKGRWSPLQRNKRTNENCSKAVHCGKNTRTIENNNNKKTNVTRTISELQQCETRREEAAQRNAKEKREREQFHKRYDDIDVKELKTSP